MRIQSAGRFAQMTLALVACAGLVHPLAAASAEPAKAVTAQAAAPALVEAFQKGPVTLFAKVTRAGAALPLFQVPVLQFKDQLELAFSGEAFDQRVTRADWSVIVVFLPRTIAPTEQGVVDFPLKHKEDRMVIPAISVPYDSIPMIFLIPDHNARKKVLKDLNDHLEAFRTLCAKIADISTQRATADKFIEDLDTIDKNLSGAQYDNALQGFLHAYGDQVSGDLQGFLASSSSNLDKCNFLAQEFRTTNLLVPAATAEAATATPVAVTPGVSTASAYVSIFFELAAIVNNLWPGHQFQYLPAVARDFRDFSADLYYSSWIRTTGDIRGAIMCCPGNWEDQQPPDFDFELPSGESLLGLKALLKARPRENSRPPFTLYGHDWKLLLTGPKGENLPPLPLDLSPNKQSFVASPQPVLDVLKQLGGVPAKARIVGRWGFASMGVGPQRLATGCDPTWRPSPQETAAFRVGKACTFKLPGSWAGSVEQVRFQPEVPGTAVLVAKLNSDPDGSRTAVFQPKDTPGPGYLEILALGGRKPVSVLPMVLADADPEVTGIEARVGDTHLTLKGKHLHGIKALELGGRHFAPTAQPPEEGDTVVFLATDGKPLEGTAGKPFQVAVITAQGRQPSPLPAALLPARPRIGLVQFIPAETKGTGLAITANVPITPTSETIQVSLLAAKNYRFPSDPTFRVGIRNAEDPTAIRTLPATKMRIMGRNEKATFILSPMDLLGGRAAGKLELQIQDDHAGASDWYPLPTTFLELPTIAAVQAGPLGFQILGQSLDQIEAVAPDPGGPWEQAQIAIEAGREVARIDTPLTGATCYIKLLGWADLVLTLKVPPVPAGVVPPATAPAMAPPEPPSKIEAQHPAS